MLFSICIATTLEVLSFFGSILSHSIMFVVYIFMKLYTDCWQGLGRCVSQNMNKSSHSHITERWRSNLIACELAFVQLVKYMANEYETANPTNGRVCLNGLVILFVFLAQNSCEVHKTDHKTYTTSIIIIHRAHCVSSFQKLVCVCVWVCALFVQFSTAQYFPLVKTEFIYVS